MISGLLARLSPESRTDLHLLVELSPYHRRIQELLASTGSGRENRKSQQGYSNASNCHGTVLYVLGLLEPVQFYHPDEMEQFLDLRCIEQEAGEIVAFGYFPVKNPTWLMHTALYLGQYQNEEIIFHQSNCGENYELSTLRRYNAISNSRWRGHFTLKASDVK